MQSTGSQNSKARSLYQILEVDQEATLEEIKQSYRKLAKIHHPDAGGDEELFKAISKAYAVLSDNAARVKYDNGTDPEECLVSDLDEAKQNLKSLTHKILNSGYFSPTHGDLVKSLKGEINSTKLKIESEIEDQESYIKTLECVKGKIKNGDFLVNELTACINEAEKGIKARQKTLEISDIMLEVLDDVEYMVEEDLEVIDWSDL